MRFLAVDAVSVNRLATANKIIFERKVFKTPVLKTQAIYYYQMFHSPLPHNTCCI